MEVKVRIYGYELVGIFGHWEPFKNSRVISYQLTNQDLEDVKRYGEFTILDKPFKGAWTDVQCSIKDLQDGIEFEGEAYSREN